MGISKPVVIQPDGSESLEKIADALTRNGVPPGLAEKLMAASTKFASDDPILSLSAAIDTHFKFHTATNISPFMLVGPSGAGKTLSIAKLATAATMAKKPVTVISADLERAGGVEQLAAFTRLLNIRLVETEDCHALRDIVSVQKDQQVFIDTPGRNPFDANDRAAAKEMISAIGDAVLTLPAGLDASEAIDMAHEFKNMGASKLLITRLDTVRRIGSVLRIACDAKLPILGYCASNKVTEPVQPINPIIMAKIILQGLREASKSQRAQSTNTATSGIRQ